MKRVMHKLEKIFVFGLVFSMLLQPIVPSMVIVQAMSEEISQDQEVEIPIEFELDDPLQDDVEIPVEFEVEDLQQEDVEIPSQENEPGQVDSQIDEILVDRGPPEYERNTSIEETNTVVDTITVEYMISFGNNSGLTLENELPGNLTFFDYSIDIFEFDVDDLIVIGHKFIGWYLTIDSERVFVVRDETLPESIKNVLIENQSIVLNAAFSEPLDPVEVTFDLMGKLTMYSGQINTINLIQDSTDNNQGIILKYNQEYGLINPYALVQNPLGLILGYRFEGWYLTRTGNDPLDQTSGILSDPIDSSTRMTLEVNHTLYAKWTPLEFTVSYDLNGGSGLGFVDENIYLLGDEVTVVSPSPYRRGYQFTGWKVSNLVDLSFINPQYDTFRWIEEFEEDFFIVQPGDTFNMLHADLVLEAQWRANLHNVIIHDAFGTIGNVEGPTDYGTIVQISAGTRQRYTFMGWSGNANFADASLNETHFRMPDHDVEVTANWRLNTHYVTVNNSFVIEPQVSGAGAHTYGSIVQINAGTRPGYTFMGWTGNVNIADVTLNTTDFRMPDHDVEVTAYWRVNLHNVIIHDAFGTIGNVEGPTAYGTIVQISAGTRPGYTFMGWTGNVNIADVTLNTTDFRMPDHDVEVTAYWRANRHNVFIHDAFGTIGNVEGPTAYGTIVQISAGTRPGYTFMGWSGNANFADASLNETHFRMPDHDVEVTANWRLNTYYVTVNNSFVIEPQVSGAGAHKYGSIVQINAGTRLGYTFIGWTGNVNIADVTLNTTDFRMPDHDVEVTAYWRANRHNVIIHDAFGTIGNVEGPSDYGTIVQISAGTRPGYTFMGWSGNANFADASLNETHFRMPDYDVEVTANWRLNTHYVTVNNSFVIEPQVSGAGAHTYGSIVQINAGTRPGYTFMGWTGNANFADSSLNETHFRMPDNDVEVTANWRLNTHYVTVNNSFVIEPQVSGAGSHTYGSIVQINAGTRPGYMFMGWTSNVVLADATLNSTDFRMPDYDVEVTAYWRSLIDLSVYTLEVTNPVIYIGLPTSQVEVETAVLEEVLIVYTFNGVEDTSVAIAARSLLSLDGPTVSLTELGFYTFTITLEGVFGTVVPTQGVTVTVIITPEDTVGIDANGGQVTDLEDARYLITVSPVAIAHSDRYTINDSFLHDYVTILDVEELKFVDAILSADHIDAVVTGGYDADGNIAHIANEFVHITGINPALAIPLPIQITVTHEFNVTFDSGEGIFNDGVNSRIVLKEGSSLVTPTPEVDLIAPANQEFAYWAIIDGQSGELTPFDLTQMVHGDLTLVAVFRTISFELRFDPNATGVTGSMSDIAGQVGIAIAIPTSEFVRTGYTQIGWNTQADGNGLAVTTTFTANVSEVINGFVTLYAVWSANTTGSETPPGGQTPQDPDGPSGQTPPASGPGGPGALEVDPPQDGPGQQDSPPANVSNNKHNNLPQTGNLMINMVVTLMAIGFVSFKLRRRVVNK